jgi:class 3 adenylate cyclase
MSFVPRRKLQAKLALAFFLLIFVFVTAFVLFASDFYESKERAALEARAAAVGSLLGQSLTNPLYALRFDEMRLLLKNALAQPDVLYAYAYDKEGKILADGTGKNPLFNTVPGDRFHGIAVKAPKLLVQHGSESGRGMGDRVEVVQPIYLPDGEKLGGVRIGFSLDAMQQRIATAKRYTLVLGALFSLLGAGISALIGRLLVRSIASLVKGTQLIASGNLDVRIPIASKDEIGILAESFNHMAASLKQNDRLARLKRYVSPQIAASILEGADDTPFQSHRREITVLFVDLRGFTAFADIAQPEEVMDLLREYHAQIGNIIFKFGGTIEHFAGDGIMVFFNDPILCEDHRERAVRTALEIREKAKELRSRWLKKGYDVDVGLGIATGYATLGNIGFEGRVDYGAIGNVTILSARLCAEAAGGQILADPKSLSEISERVETEPLGELRLKGFLRPVAVVNVLRLKEA